MYSFDQKNQVNLFLLSLGLGFLLGIFYDIVRTVRISFTKSRAAVIIFDILYFLFVAVATFLFILSVNKGEIRFYFLFGEIIGWLIYYFTFGVAAIKISDCFARIIKRTGECIKKVVSAPFRLFFGLLGKFFRKVAVLFKKTQKKSRKNRKKLLPKIKLYVYNLKGMLKR